MKTNTITSIDAFIASAPPESREKMKQLRSLLKRLAPQAEETIAYGIPTLKLNGNLVHFSGYKSHLGFYPGADGIEHFHKEISGYKSAKGSVQFPLNEPLPVQLITEILKFRIAQQMAKTKVPKSKERVCKNGHVFIKTSDCPTCPKCEQMKKPAQGLLASVSAPARRALEAAGIHQVKDLRRFSESDVMALHGIGRKVMLIIREIMSDAGIDFKK